MQVIYREKSFMLYALLGCYTEYFGKFIVRYFCHLQKLMHFVTIWVEPWEI